MGQMDRLSALDATFLHQERESSHMHIGGVAVFEGPCPGLEEFIEYIDGRLGGLPRYRQKLLFGRLGPRWVDDPGFDLRFHVRAAALPSPAGDLELSAFVAQVAGQRLDRSRPLWECRLVEMGVSGFALVFKSHHAMVDGVSNFDLATVLLDLEPGGGGVGFGHHTTGGWSPRPAPSRFDLLAADARDVMGSGVGLAGRALGAAVRPDRAVRGAVDVAAGVGELAWAAMNPAPPTPLNVEIGPHRRYAVVHQSLAEYKMVKDTFGGTINDVVLTVVSGALRRWLRGRSVDVDELELRALVPVSVRSADSAGSMGNQLSMFRAPLPVSISDPVGALGVVRAAMRGLKESRQAVAASTLAAAAEVAPPGVLAQASRLQFSTRLFNLLVTNIPGPQFPLYLLGRRALGLYPLPFLAEHHGLAVAIISYDGQVEYGLLGDYDALPDLNVIAEGIDFVLEELVAAAAASLAVRETRRRRDTQAGDAPTPQLPVRPVASTPRPPVIAPPPGVGGSAPLPRVGQPAPAAGPTSAASVDEAPESGLAPGAGLSPVRPAGAPTPTPQTPAPAAATQGSADPAGSNPEFPAPMTDDDPSESRDVDPARNARELAALLDPDGTRKPRRAPHPSLEPPSPAETASAAPDPAPTASDPATAASDPATAAPGAAPEPDRAPAEPTADPAAEDDTGDIPLMGSTTRRRSGPGSDMRAKRRNS